MSDDTNQTHVSREQSASEPVGLNASESHVAGAIIVPRSPFTDIQVPTNPDPLQREFVERWIRPLYMDFFNQSSDSAVEALWPEMNHDIAYELLSYFNWRPRVVGGYIVALKQLHELTDLVGKLLLRSDVSFAGRSYCVALAQLNTPESRQFLHAYLEYYLTRNDLWFDQSHAMGAVAYLDRINGTNDIVHFTAAWDSFVQDKPRWDLSQSCMSFSSQMDRIKFLIGKPGS
jgi:hypothetical protein